MAETTPPDRKSPDSSDDRQSTSGPTTLRVWPAVLLLGLLILVRYLPSLIEDGPSWLWAIAAFGPLLVSLIIGLWWLTFSRATWLEKAVGLTGLGLAFGVNLAWLDSSMLGPGVICITIPMGTAAFASLLVIGARLQSLRRTLFAVLAGLIGFGFSGLLRAEGMWGDYQFGLAWRWKPTAEEQFLAGRKRAPVNPLQPENRPGEMDPFTDPEWPGFRGPDRAGVQQGEAFDSAWSERPPQEIWRIRVGPAWSSFAVNGSRLYTQEQRDSLECVVCYDASSGAEIWSQGIESRFSDPLGGPGPRATPSLAAGSVYAMGAEGWLLKLDADTGEILWKADLRVVAAREPPMWGFSSSPFLIDDLVVVYAGGEGDRGILAFDTLSGQLQWSAAASPQSYGSLQTLSVGDRSCLALLTDRGLQMHDPDDGHKVLEYEWPYDGYRALQPHRVEQNQVLIPTGMGAGCRLIQVSLAEDGMQAEEVWTSRSLKPDFNDLVSYDGFAYGFDSSIFACIDLASGERMWKQGRYGKGQVLLLKDSALLLVVSERGELILLEATPEEHRELATLQALEGKTWNHPVIVGENLYLRNAREAVCYRLPTKQKT